MTKHLWWDQQKWYPTPPVRRDLPKPLPVWLLILLGIVLGVLLGLAVAALAG